MKQYMVIERFAPGWKEKVYSHFEKHGRLLPPGLEYINSWRVKDDDKCFQLMQTENYALFQEWEDNWNKIGLWGTIEIIELES